MTLALIAAVGIALSYGLATVLQSVGAKRTEAAQSLDPGLFVRLLGSVPYVVGLLLDGAGFILTVIALQTLPLFVVEAFTAGSLAVTAVAAARWLRIRLTRGEWAGVVAVTIGLVALGLSAGENRSVALSSTANWLPLIVSFGLLVAAYAVARVPGRLGVAALGATAGLGFGIVGIATRTLGQPLSVSGLITDPGAYAIVIAGAVALLALATALQRGGVTQATAAMVVAETILPSAIGLAFLGDTIRAGYQGLASIGMLVAVGGSVALARLGEIPDEPPASSSNAEVRDDYVG